MTKHDYKETPIIVSRDAGYNLAELISPENRRISRKIVENPHYKNSKYKLKELFSEIGIIVNPEAMTYLYKY